MITITPNAAKQIIESARQSGLENTPCASPHAAIPTAPSNMAWASTTPAGTRI